MATKERSSIGRRELLGALGVGVASSAAFVQSSEPLAQEVSVPPLKVVDFHNHFVGPSFTLTTQNRTPPALRQNQARIDAQLADQRALIDSLDRLVSRRA